MKWKTFTFMHLSDAFIQSDLQCIQAIHVLKTLPKTFLIKTVILIFIQRHEMINICQLKTAQTYRTQRDFKFTLKQEFIQLNQTGDPHQTEKSPEGCYRKTGLLKDRH